MDTKQIMTAFLRSEATHFIVNPWGNTPVKLLSHMTRPDGVRIGEVEDAFGEQFTERMSRLVPLS